MLGGYKSDRNEMSGRVENFGNWQDVSDVEWRGQFVATVEHEKLSQK